MNDDDLKTAKALLEQLPLEGTIKIVSDDELINLDETPGFLLDEEEATIRRVDDPNFLGEITDTQYSTPETSYRCRWPNGEEWFLEASADELFKKKKDFPADKTKDLTSLLLLRRQSIVLVEPS